MKAPTRERLNGKFWILRNLRGGLAVDTMRLDRAMRKAHLKCRALHHLKGLYQTGLVQFELEPVPGKRGAIRQRHVWRLAPEFYYASEKELQLELLRRVFFD